MIPENTGDIYGPDSSLTDSSSVPVPLVKHELVMQRCPNLRAISVCVASNRAHQWLKLCECYFDNISHIMLGECHSLPMTTTLIVPDCYDFEEVWNYVGNKPWARNS